MYDRQSTQIISWKTCKIKYWFLSLKKQQEEKEKGEGESGRKREKRRKRGNPSNDFTLQKKNQIPYNGQQDTSGPGTPAPCSLLPFCSDFTLVNYSFPLLRHIRHTLASRSSYLFFLLSANVLPDICIVCSLCSNTIFSVRPSLTIP